MQPQNCDFNSYIYIFIYIFIQHKTRLVFWILVIKSNLTEVSEQPRGGTPALTSWRYVINVIKQRTLVADVDVAPPHGVA